MKKLVIATCIFFSSVSYAQGIFVEGTIDCGQWLNARNEKKAEYLEHFLVGLVSGMALGRMMEIWRTNGVAVRRDQLNYWMDGYCKKNPLEGVLRGAVEFSDERTSGAFSKKALQLK